MNKEELLFHLLKDKVVLPSYELKKKYPGLNTNELRLRIINYQVDKYGYQLDRQVEHQDYKTSIRNARQRKYDRRNALNKEYL